MDRVGELRALGAEGDTSAGCQAAGTIERDSLLAKRCINTIRTRRRIGSGIVIPQTIIYAKPNSFRTSIPRNTDNIIGDELHRAHS